MLETITLAVLFQHATLSENDDHLETQVLERSCAPENHINTHEIGEIGGRFVEGIRTPKTFAKSYYVHPGMCVLLIRQLGPHHVLLLYPVVRIFQYPGKDEQNTCEPLVCSSFFKLICLNCQLRTLQLQYVLTLKTQSLKDDDFF